MTPNLSPRARFLAPVLTPILAWLALVFLAPVATAQPPSVVTVSTALTPEKLAPGGRGVVAVTFTIQDHWHINAGDMHEIPGTDPNLIATSAVLKATPAITPKATQWPKPILKDLSIGGMLTKLAYYEGKVTVFVPFVVSPDAPAGKVPLELTYESQACAESCLMPEGETVTLTLDIAPDHPKAPATWPEGFNTSKFEAAAATTPPGPASNPGAALAPGATPGAATPMSSKIDVGLFSFDASGAGGFVVLLAVCFVAGFILNLMPCVLPVIPLKIAGFQRAAEHQGGGRGRALLLGTMTGLGVVAFWLGIAILLSGLKWIQSVNELFGNPYFQIIAAIVILVMALGMMGAFIINLPQALQGVSVGHDSLFGSFMFGVMTAVLGTPCFGPFIGAALSWATQQENALIPLTAITTVGIGMAVPYVVLSAFPGLAKKLPKAGPMSDMVKHVLGLLMIAVAVFFLWNGILSLLEEKAYLKSVLHWWAMAGLSAIAGILIVRTAFKHAKSTGGKVVAAILSLVLIVTPALWAKKLQDIAYHAFLASSMWHPYSPEAEAQAIKDGKIVLIDFTAEWCINCKVMEASVVATEKVEGEIKAAGVVALKADLTSRTAPGWKRLNELGERGIPVFAIHGPGNPTPTLLRFGATQQDFVDAIQKSKPGGASLGPWRPYTAEAEREAKAAGKTVVTWFTADWCISVKVALDTVLQTDEVSKLLADPNVVPLIANVTSTDAEGWAKLKELNEPGIPLLAIEQPGQPATKLTFGWTTEDVRVALARPETAR